VDVGAGQLRGNDFDEIMPKLLGELSGDVGLAAARRTVEEDSIRDGETVPQIGLRIPEEISPNSGMSPSVVFATPSETARLMLPAAL